MNKIKGAKPVMHVCTSSSYLSSGNIVGKQFFKVKFVNIITLYHGPTKIFALQNIIATTDHPF